MGASDARRLKELESEIAKPKKLLADALRITEAWRVDYNCNRRHGALGSATPVDFAPSDQEHAHGEITRRARQGQTQVIELPG